MSKGKTTEEFIKEARIVHGDKYDYSNVKYINCKTKVDIICPMHGCFCQTPEAHLRQKQGCPICGNEKKKRPVEGVGIYDKSMTSATPIYNLWRQMLKRCYNEKSLERRPTYKGCSVCSEWLIYSNFEKWVLDVKNCYKVGYQLDKDILVKGNKLYSPQTCCLVPQNINIQISKHIKKGKEPVGVFFHHNGKYYVHCASPKYKSGFVGTYNDCNEAFNAYKNAREERLKEIAEEYKGSIADYIYKALCNYKVEITD